MRKQILEVKETDALNMILDILERHERELARLISKLSDVTEQLRETNKVLDQMDGIDKRIEALRDELSVLLKCNFGNTQ